MTKKYTRKHFQSDLKKLANLIENYKSYNMKGGKKIDKKTGQPIEYRTFQVVQIDGETVEPFGTYRINKNQPVGPESAASKAARIICKRVRENGSNHKVCDGKTLMLREKTRGGSGKHFGPYEIRVKQLSPSESKKRTEGLIEGLQKRLEKPKSEGGMGLSKAAAKKMAKKKTKKITHKIYAQIISK